MTPTPDTPRERDDKAAGLAAERVERAEILDDERKVRASDLKEEGEVKAADLARSLRRFRAEMRLLYALVFVVLIVDKV